MRSRDERNRATVVPTKADLATLEARLVKWVVGIVLAVAGLQTAALFAMLRLMNRSLHDGSRSATYSPEWPRPPMARTMCWRPPAR